MLGEACVRAAPHHPYSGCDPGRLLLRLPGYRASVISALLRWRIPPPLLVGSGASSPRRPLESGRSPDGRAQHLPVSVGGGRCRFASCRSPLRASRPATRRASAALRGSSPLEERTFLSRAAPSTSP